MLLQFVPLLPVFIFFCLLAIRFWGIAVVAALAWAMVEGAVRKWVFPGLQQPLLLVKDAVLIFAYAGHMFLAKPDQVGKSKVFKMLLVLLAAFCALQVLNPKSPSFLLSLYGLKNYIVYLPLALIMTDVIDTRRKLQRLLMGICLMAIPLSLLGLYQFSQPPASWINQYLNHEEGVTNNTSTFGAGEDMDGFETGRARTSSTFSYIGGFVTFLIMAVPVATALLLAAIPKRRALIMVSAALILSLGAAATTGSRSPFAIFAVGAVFILLTSVAKGMLSLPTLIRIGVGVITIGGLSLWLAGGAYDALEYRANNSDTTSSRLTQPFVEVTGAFMTSPITGYGIGTNSNASLTIMNTDTPYWLEGHAFEDELARVMQELGFVGFTLMYLTKIVAIFMMAGYLRQSKSPLMIATHMAMLTFVGVHLILITVNNPTGGLMYFAAIGVAMAAHAIELRERRSANDQRYYEAQGYPLQHVAMA